MSTPLAELLTSALRDLSRAEFERLTYRTWLIAAVERLHDQDETIERQRRQLADQREQIRRLLDVAAGEDAA